MDGLKDPALFRQQAFLAGQWIDADGGRTIDICNPADRRCVASVPDCGAAETARAIEAAAQAWTSWRRLTARRRADILMRWYALILANRDDLALIMTREQGKPLSEARGEIVYAASFVQWFAEEAKRVYGETVPSPWPDARVLVLPQPVGVCAAITPWNFPAAMVTRKLAPALAAGCTVVLKPALQTPLSALALVELAQRAGVPDGVVNVLTGEATPIGTELCRNPVVRKLSFTGSTAVGRLLMAQCAPTIKKLSLELGGNAPFIVFDDADLDAAVAGAMASKFRNSGQTCICPNRFLVQRNVFDRFADKLACAVSALKVGRGEDAGVEQGPLIEPRALHKVETLVDEALAQGARALCGGHRHALGGTWYAPTVLTEVRPGMRVATEEVFGPVAPLIAFDSDDEAVALANDTQSGLAAYFYARDYRRVWRMSEALEYGMVGVNTGTLSTTEAPFGGMKESGLGREGARQGLDEYLELKYVAVGGL